MAMYIYFSPATGNAYWNILSLEKKTFLSNCHDQFTPGLQVTFDVRKSMKDLDGSIDAVLSKSHNLTVQFSRSGNRLSRVFDLRFLSYLAWNTGLLNLICFLSLKVCGGNFFGSQGIISSPNYPNYYFSNADCLYKIEAPSGFRVKVKFQDFHLENAGEKGMWDPYTT